MSDRKCTAKKASTGAPCRMAPIVGGMVCPAHGGRAPQVRAKANRRVADMLADAIDPDRVMREAGRLAYSDIRELFDATGNFLPVKKWPDDIARAVSSVEVVKKNVTSGDGKVDDVLKVRLWDKTGRLHDLMTHHGQLTEKVEVTVVGGLVERLHAGRKRIAGAKR